MGTNYYLIKPASLPCDHCGRSDAEERLHVGKSSGGWKFIFNSNYGAINSFKEWKILISDPRNILIDEYNERQEPEEFYKFVDSKQDGIGMAEYVKRYPDRDYGDDAKDIYDPDGYIFSRYHEFS